MAIDQLSKTVLITGVSRGIGLHLTKHYVTIGWNVIAAVRNPEPATKLRELKPWKIVQLDTSDEQSILSVAADLSSIPIDVLINNAAIAEGGDVIVTTKTDMMHQFEVNVTGPFLTTRALLPSLKLAAAASGSAFVINVSSFVGSLQLNAEGNFAAGGYYGYRTSKTALNMITKNLAIDFKDDNIGFVPIHPGYVATDMTNHAEGAIDVETSVTGIAKVISGLTLADSGKFLDYEGNTLPW